MASQEERIKFIFDTKDNTKKDFKSIALGIVGITQGIQLAKQAAQAFKKAYDFGKEGAAAKRLAQAGEQLSNSYQEVVDTIQTASGDTVDSMSAMSAANKALVLGVAKTPEEFEKLTKAAVALGRATGRTATQSIEDLTTGIGRQSKLILDNLGIVYQAEKVYDDYAESIGKTAEELTDSERKQALVNIAIEKANDLLDENGDLVKDAAASYEELDANIADANLRFKEHVNDALLPAVEAANDVFNAQELLNSALESGAVDMADWGIMMKAQSATGVDAYMALAVAVEEYELKMRDANAADLLFSNYLTNIPLQSMESATALGEMGIATEGLAEKELRLLQVEAILAGNYELATTIGKKIKAIEEQEGAIEDLIKVLDELDGKTIDYKVRASVETYGGGAPVKASPGEGGKGYASGANFTVPSGYPNDSFPMRVESGEHVKVTPAGESGNADVVAAINELKQEQYQINQELISANS